MRYSVHDLATIKSTIEGWVDGELCTLPDLFPNLRDDASDTGKCTKEHQALLTELAAMFPSRKKSQVIQCAKRIMGREEDETGTTPWTDEQVVDQCRLVEEKGNKVMIAHTHTHTLSHSLTHTHTLTHCSGRRSAASSVIQATSAKSSTQCISQGARRAGALTTRRTCSWRRRFACSPPIPQARSRTLTDWM